MPNASRGRKELLAEIAALTRRVAELEAQYAQSQELERSLRSNEHRLRRLLESVTDYVYTVSVRDGQAVATIHGPNCVAVTGYTAEEYRQNPLLWLAMVPEADRPAVLEHAARVLAGDPAPLEHRILHKDGTIRFVRNTPVLHRDEAGRIFSYDGIINDVTERRRAEELVTRMSLHDGLTGLPNRALYMDRLRQTLALAERSGETAAVYFVDLDRFKEVNDAFGHEAGDRVLVEAAKRLAACVRRSDTVARLGGDEFVILTPLVDPKRLADFARTINQALARTYQIDDHRMVIGSSIGVVTAPGDGITVDNAIARADLALYRAKAKGGDTYEFFEAEMNAAFLARRRMEMDLAGAIEDDRITVHYQPLVDLDSGAVVAFEALARWEHPTHGFVPPSDFIALAEETGQIDTIGRIVMEKACSDAARWPNDVRVAINLSPVQFRSGSLFANVKRALKLSGLHATR
ncbi:MAG TPA: hypothetical protein DIU49_01800, partial [Desulfovibrio sp.]|nr:hypothetical protein [Desulfovibrio sp.]